MRYKAHSNTKEDSCLLKHMVPYTSVYSSTRESECYTAFLFSEYPQDRGSMLLQHTLTYTLIYVVYTLLAIPYKWRKYVPPNLYRLHKTVQGVTSQNRSLKYCITHLLSKKRMEGREDGTALWDSHMCAPISTFDQFHKLFMEHGMNVMPPVYT